MPHKIQLVKQLKINVSHFNTFRNSIDREVTSLCEIYILTIDF